MHKMLVLAMAKPGRADALAQWYDEQHMNDLLAIRAWYPLSAIHLPRLKAPTAPPNGISC